jgi:hypothetical protein
VPLGEDLAHALDLGLELLQVCFELSHPLLAVAEAPVEALPALPTSTVAAMAAVMRARVLPAPVVLTFVATAAAGIFGATAVAAVTGAGAPTALLVTSAASAATATFL